MALKIRLRQHGRKNRPFYRLVVLDSKCRREGKYVECIGTYNPFEETDDKKIMLKPDRLEHWMSVGAILSDQVRSLSAKAAPAVLKKYREKALALQAKLTTKSRERRRKKAKVVAAKA